MSQAGVTRAFVVSHHDAWGGCSPAHEVQLAPYAQVHIIIPIAMAIASVSRPSFEGSVDKDVRKHAQTTELPHLDRQARFRASLSWALDEYASTLVKLAR
jgi:hypothetical protein